MGPAGADWSSLAAPLAGQFEQWLRGSQPANPWFAAMSGQGAPLSPAWSLGPLPLGAAAAPQADMQRSFELLTRLTQLQTQLAAYWGEIANTAARKFVARLGAGAVGGTVTARSTAPTPENALKLYELWVDCAEEAYAAVVHRDDFSRLQAELTNTSAALLAEQRRNAETLARTFGLPTRNEVDALYAQIKELRRQFARVMEPGGVAREGPEAAPERRAAPAPRAKRTGKRLRARKSKR